MLSKRDLIDILVRMEENEIKEIDLSDGFYLWAEKNDNGDGVLGWCLEIHNRLQEDDTFCESIGIYDIIDFDYDYLVKYISNQKLNKLLSFADRQEQLYIELERYPKTWKEVLDGETKEDWLFGELYYFIKLIKDLKDLKRFNRLKRRRIKIKSESERQRHKN
jgi:hypothetical protein